jgi:hypothetical protein
MKFVSKSQSLSQVIAKSFLPFSQSGSPPLIFQLLSGHGLTVFQCNSSKHFNIKKTETDE